VEDLAGFLTVHLMNREGIAMAETVEGEAEDGVAGILVNARLRHHYCVLQISSFLPINMYA